MRHWLLLLYSEKYSANMKNCYVMPCMEGMYSGDDNADDSSLFMCERHALTDLLDGLEAPCSCGMIRVHGLWIQSFR